ncbi:MAG TPA: cation:proton antiporter, partial [Nitrospira sp.]|nr:cation:proton antiporter [Nitrospira sp.]
MEPIFITATLWLALAVVSALVASSLRVSIALVEICVGVGAAAATGSFGLGDVLAVNSEWVRFLAASGAVVLTFLAGAELDPDVIKTKLTEVSVVGLVGFFAPFLGCAAIAYYGLGWDPKASWLCGIALSTTSMAVVYAVMLETGFNKTEFGKGI